MVSEPKKLRVFTQESFGKSAHRRFSKMRGANIFQNAQLAKSLSTNL
jgi:hypothetical protein